MSIVVESRVGEAIASAKGTAPSTDAVTAVPAEAESSDAGDPDLLAAQKKLKKAEMKRKLKEPWANKALPFFHPELWLARRTCCLNVLRRLRAKNVVDLGCGPGALLQVLTRPAYYADCFPEEYQVEPFTLIPAGPNSIKDLRIEKMIGVDADGYALDQAQSVVSDMLENTENMLRWQPLDIKLWEGNVEDYNPRIAQDLGQPVDVVTFVEVLEHLTPEALERFPATLFTQYAPRVAVITTPNHAFNPYFVSSWARNLLDDSDNEEEMKRPVNDLHRFPDPTGRTNRVFRHPEHTFEWTQEELQEWCEAQVNAYPNYTYIIDGVGSLSEYFGSVNEPVPHPPPSLREFPGLEEYEYPPSDPSEFYASFVVTFERKSEPLIAQGDKSTGEHILHSENMVLSSCSLEEVEDQDIVQFIRDYLADFHVVSVSLHQLWNEQDLQTLCRGRIGKIIEELLGKSIDWTFQEKIEDKESEETTKGKQLKKTGKEELSLEDRKHSYPEFTLVIDRSDELKYAEQAVIIVWNWWDFEIPEAEKEDTSKKSDWEFDDDEERLFAELEGREYVGEDVKNEQEDWKERLNFPLNWVKNIADRSDDWGANSESHSSEYIKNDAWAVDDSTNSWDESSMLNDPTDTKADIKVDKNGWDADDW